MLFPILDEMVNGLNHGLHLGYLKVKFRFKLVLEFFDRCFFLFITCVNEIEFLEFGANHSAFIVELFVI